MAVDLQMKLASVSHLEELAIIKWISQLIDWGWPPRTKQLTSMTTHLLRCKSDFKSSMLDTQQNDDGRRSLCLAARASEGAQDGHGDKVV